MEPMKTSVKKPNARRWEDIGKFEEIHIKTSIGSFDICVLDGKLIINQDLYNIKGDLLSFHREIKINSENINIKQRL